MTSKLQSLTELWQEFDLTGTQKLLDELATEIAYHQEGVDYEMHDTQPEVTDVVEAFKAAAWAAPAEQVW